MSQSADSDKPPTLTPTVGAPNGSAPAAKPVQPASDFNPKRFRLGQNFAERLQLNRPILSVPVRKAPDDTTFFRVHPGPEWSTDAGLLLVRIDKGEVAYLLDSALVNAGAVPQDQIKPVMLFTCMTRDKVLFLWRCRLNPHANRSDEWARTSLEIAAKAQTTWVRMFSNMALGAFECEELRVAEDEPAWPTTVDFAKLLSIGFKDKLIEDPDHLVLRRLKGLA
jgi:hypothetical protein